MAAPLFVSVGARLAGATSAAANIAVPTAITPAAGIIDLAFIGLGDSNATTVTAAPSGFLAAASAPVSGAGSGSMKWFVYYRHAVGDETGTYDFTLSAAAFRAAWVARYTGCINTGVPFEASTNATNSGSTSFPDVSVTTTAADRLIVWSAAAYNGRSFTPPTGFAKNGEGATNDSENGMSLASMAQAASGGPGTITGGVLSAGTNVKAVWAAALLPAASAPPVNTNQFFAMF